MSSRGLPGFLRRTLRVDYSFDEDDGDEGGRDSSHSVVGVTQPPQTSTREDSSHRSESENEESNNSEPKESNLDEKDEVMVSTISSDDHDNTSAANSTPMIPVPSKYAASDDKILPLDASTSDSAVSLAPRSYRDVQFDKVMEADVINMAELRKLAWNGIPSRHRAAAWKILLGYWPTNKSRRAASLARKRADYREAVLQHYDIHDDTRTAQEQETLRQVLVDVPRTAPEVPLFRNERLRRSLSRLLYVWAMRHPASSYVQGINDLATPLVVVFLADHYEGEDVLDGHVMHHLSSERLDDLEADVYGCLTNLLSGIQDHYTSDQPGVQRMVMRLQELVQRIDADLCAHLDEMGVQFLQFSFRWMNCLLLREFELRCVIRLWDTYISEKDGFEGFHVYVCAAFLCQFSPQLQAMNFDELLGFMQKIPTQDWTDTEVEMLLSQAFVLSTLFGGSDAHLTSGNQRRENNKDG